MPIGWLAKADLPEAIRLVKRVFMEFEAPEYSQEGVENFPFSWSRETWQLCSRAANFPSTGIMRTGVWRG